MSATLPVTSIPAEAENRVAVATQRQLIWCAEYQVDFTGHQVLEFRGGATIWHEGKLRPGLFLKQRS